VSTPLPAIEIHSFGRGLGLPDGAARQAHRERRLGSIRSRWLRSIDPQDFQNQEARDDDLP